LSADGRLVIAAYWSEKCFASKRIRYWLKHELPCVAGDGLVFDAADRRSPELPNKAVFFLIFANPNARNMVCSCISTASG
jgi:hypothetical protein